MATSKPYVSENPNLTPLAKLAGWLLLIVLSVVAIAYLWYPHASKFWSRYTGGSTAPFGVRQSVSNGRPRLQVDEIVDFQTYKKKQDGLLTTYGWTDKAQGVVRIPIDRAIERLLERGVPVRKAAP